MDDFGKLENGVLRRAPKKIEKNGNTYINSAEAAIDDGYKPIIANSVAAIPEDDSNMILQGYSYTEDDNAIYVEPVFKSLEELQKEQEEYESSRQYNRDEVIDILIKNMINQCDVTDAQALKMIDYYPTTSELKNKTAAAGTIINENGKLYKVKKEHEITGTLDKTLCQKVTAVKLDTKLDTSKVNVSSIKPVDLNVQIKK